MYLLNALLSIKVNSSIANCGNFTKKVDGRSKSRSIFDDRPKSRVVDFRRPTANTSFSHFIVTFKIQKDGTPKRSQLFHIHYSVLLS